MAASLNKVEYPRHGKALKILKQIERVILDAPTGEMDDEVLHAFVDQYQVCLGKLHDTITKTYFPLASEQAA